MDRKVQSCIAVEEVKLLLTYFCPKSNTLAIAFYSCCIRWKKQWLWISPCGDALKEVQPWAGPGSTISACWAAEPKIHGIGATCFFIAPSQACRCQSSWSCWMRKVHRQPSTRVLIGTAVSQVTLAGPGTSPFWRSSKVIWTRSWAHCCVCPCLRGLEVPANLRHTLALRFQAHLGKIISGEKWPSFLWPC